MKETMIVIVSDNFGCIKSELNNTHSLFNSIVI